MIYMNMNDEKNVKHLIRDMFKLIGIELEDSPQILDNYLYLEFENHSGNTEKIRLPYKNKEYFLNLNQLDLELFIFKGITVYKFGWV